MKKVFKYSGRAAQWLLNGAALAMGADAGILMAAAPPLPDAGVTKGGNELFKGTSENLTTAGAAAAYAANADGIATETFGRENGDPDMYQADIDARITKIRPMATPIDQISRFATAQKSDSFEVKYYSVGTRPVKTKLRRAVEAASTGTSVAITVADPDMFTLDDTIRVVGVKAVTDFRGAPYDQDSDDCPDLVLCVCGKTSEGQPIVFAVNGNKISNQPIGVPAIPQNTVLIRMGKSCGELDVQTGRFNNLPTSEMQYCQNFMAQIEQSTLDKIAAKEVNWGFSDLEEDSIYDMRLAMENSFLFGDMGMIKHTSKDGMAQWFTKGIWWQAGKDLKFRLKDTVEVWNLKFKSWETDFGEILAMHDELFDLNGMSDHAFALDPEFLTKKTHLSWSRNILDLKKAGVRNTDAVVIQEISCLYLRYAKAHARLRLAASA